MRRLGWRLVLVGCVASAAAGVALASLRLQPRATHSRIVTPGAATRPAGHPTLRGGIDGTQATASAPDPDARGAQGHDPVEEDLSGARWRPAVLHQLSRLSARYGIVYPLTRLSEPAATGWLGRVTMDLLAHERIREIVRDRQIPRSVVEALVLALAASGLLEALPGPDLAAALLPTHAAAWRSRGSPEALEALRVQLASAVEDPDARFLLDAHLTAPVSAPWISTATDAVGLAQELDDVTAGRRLDERLDDLETQLDRAERLHDRTRDACVLYLDASYPRPPGGFRTAALRDLIKGLLIAGVPEERILGADLASAYAAMGRYQEREMYRRLDYERLWGGFQLEEIAALGATHLEHSEGEPLLRALEDEFGLGAAQVDALVHYFGVRLRR